jgi:hypothetical protein
LPRWRSVLTINAEKTAATIATTIAPGSDARVSGSFYPFRKQNVSAASQTTTGNVLGALNRWEGLRPAEPSAYRVVGVEARVSGPSFDQPVLGRADSEAPRSLLDAHAGPLPIPPQKVTEHRHDSPA